MLTTIQTTPYLREVTVILQMLLWSDKRLTLEACNDAIVVQPDKQPGFSSNDRFVNPRDVVNVCSGLVKTNRSEYGTEDLHLAHASVREYLLSEEAIQPVQSHLTEKIARSNLLRICHTYLGCVDWNMWDQRAIKPHQGYPLLIWAILTWPAHVKYVEAIDDEKLASVLDFLQLAPESFFMYSSMGALYRAPTAQYSPLYFTALMGLRHSCARLLQYEVDVCSSEANSENNIPTALVDGHDDRIHRFSGSTQRNTNLALQIRLDASLLAA